MRVSTRGQSRFPSVLLQPLGHLSPLRPRTYGCGYRNLAHLRIVSDLVVTCNDLRLREPSDVLTRERNCLRPRHGPSFSQYAREPRGTERFCRRLIIAIPNPSNRGNQRTAYPVEQRIGGPPQPRGGLAVSAGAARPANTSRLQASPRGSSSSSQIEIASVAWARARSKSLRTVRRPAAAASKILIPHTSPGVFSIVETATITGGTGRFTGATGSLVVERSVDLNTLFTTGSFEGVITY